MLRSGTCGKRAPVSGSSGPTDGPVPPNPVAIRGPGYSIDSHADGNERADDVITVLQPDGALVHGPVYQQDGHE